MGDPEVIDLFDGDEFPSREAFELFASGRRAEAVAQMWAERRKRRAERGEPDDAA